MIATLGPEGTFSNEAVRKYFAKNKEMAEKFTNYLEEVIFCDNIGEVFENVKRGRIGVVPVENMIDGSVGETLDLLYKEKVYIVDEIILPINLCLASKGKGVERIVSHPKALGQARDYIRDEGYQEEKVSSTAKAMRIVSNSNEKLGAIGSELAAEKYNLNIDEKNVEDNNNNVTRFLVLSLEKNEDCRSGSKDFKTSMAVHPGEDRPGLLYDLLKAFREKKINLTKIESRPTKINLGEYIFYIDFNGHELDSDCKDALREVKKMADVRIFGSYECQY